MAINLVKGQNAKLDQDFDVFHVGLGWDVNEGVSQFDFDLDVSAFMINENKKLISDNFLVFYNSEDPYRVAPERLDEPQHPDETKYPAYTDENGVYHTSEMHWREKTRPISPEWSVIGSIDDMDGLTSEDGDDETMDINLNKVDPRVKEIVITVSIYDYINRRQNFGQVERAYVRLYKPGQAEGEGEYIYDLTEDFSACASVEFCRLYRKDGGWKIQALGIGHKGGLEELVSKFQ